jgi:hypothetical protein
MTENYSIESIQEKLESLRLPFCNLFARAPVALLTARKISIHEITHLMPGEQNAEANRQQIRRCLDHESLTQEHWTRAIAALLPARPWVLAMDRTEWRRGGMVVNLLVLSVVAHGCSIPLLWIVMPECGASDTAERKELVGRFIALFGTESVMFLTADREFIGKDWIGWLLEARMPFRIRIKASEYLLHEDGREYRAWEWFMLRACRCKTRAMWLWGLPVFVGGKRLVDGKYLVIISDGYSEDLWADYRSRWKIETLFQALKGRGFDLESCRVSQERRLSGWFGFLALGLCRCLKVGQNLEEAHPLPLKNHGRRSMSIFQRGLRELQSLLAPLSGNASLRRFSNALGLLIPRRSLEI